MSEIREEAQLRRIRGRERVSRRIMGELHTENARFKMPRGSVQ